MTKQGSNRARLASILFINLTVIILLGQTSLQAQSRLTMFRPGDAFRLQIWQPWRIADGKAEILDLNGDYPINSQGYAILPLVGEVKVIGLNQTSLTESLKEKYSPYIKDPYIMVTPLIRVTLQGAINLPGAFLVPPTASLWELVELAKGPRANADLKKMRVERAGRIVNKNLLKSFEKGYSLQEIGIFSGDQIIVPGRTSFTYKDVLDLLSFGMSILVVYATISNN
ncbi:MAG: polysaccharide biosynthesis/export family protein [bacterium]